jgi:hypothetical protein
MQQSPNHSVCERAGVEPQPPRPGTKVGLALSTLGQSPIHGLRIPPAEGTNGWYIWCGGEMSQAADFFAPLHVEHLADYLPSALEYLYLPPGYRFLIDGAGHEDVWFDIQLLEA